MSIWTEDRVRRLRTLWLQGWSAQRVADDLGAEVSRSAVLGKVHRLKLSSARAGPVRIAGPRAASPKPLCTPSLTSATPRRAARCEGVSAPACGTATILTVGRCDCRFPYGDPKESAFRLCGRPAERGAFCVAHAAIAYRGGPQTPDILLHLAGLT